MIHSTEFSFLIGPFHRREKSIQFRLGLLPKISLAVNSTKRVKFYLYHAWMVQIRHALAETVWDCHLVRLLKWSVWIPSWLSTANFMESNRQKIFFLFQHLTFMVWLICILNLFHFGEGRNSTIEAFKRGLFRSSGKGELPWKMKRIWSKDWTKLGSNRCVQIAHDDI